MRLRKGKRTATRLFLYCQLEGRTLDQESMKKLCPTVLEPSLRGQGQSEQSWVFSMPCNCFPVFPILGNKGRCQVLFVFGLNMKRK